MAFEPFRTGGDFFQSGDKPMTILRHYLMTAAEGRGEELRAALVDLAAKVALLPGCEQIEISVDSDNEHVYIFVEHWRSISDHKAGGEILGKAAFAPIGAVLAAAPEGRYLQPLPLG